jgi:hypothetical protein
VRVAFAALLLVMASPLMARAQPLRVAIAPIEGPLGASTRRAFAEALRERGEEVLPFDRVDEAKVRHGTRTIRLMGRLEADVFIEGRATRANTDLRMVRRGAVRSVHLRSSARDPSARLEALLARYEAERPPSERRAPADEAVEEREVVEAEPEVADEEPDVMGEEPAEPGPPTDERVAPSEPARARRLPRDMGRYPRVFEGGVSLGFVSRKLRYRDDIFDRAGGYTLSAAPSIGLHARTFPLAPLRMIGLEDLGISLRGEQDFIESSSREGVSFRTYGARWDLDLLYRFPLGRFQTSAWFGYHRRVFSIDSAIARPGQDNLPGVPNVRYEGLRFGAEGRARIYRGIFVDLRLSYLAILGAGAIQSDLWFPNGRAGGLELGGNLIYRFSSFMDARLGVDFERIHHAFDPSPGDRYIVGGAADRFTVFWLGLGFYR